MSFDLLGDEITENDDDFEDEDDFGTIAHLDDNEDEDLSPISTPYLYGHTEQLDHLRELISGNRLPHGMIFSGPKGIGKTTLAYRLSRYLLHPDESEKNPEDFSIPVTGSTFRQVARESHPDCRSFKKEINPNTGRASNNIGVDHIRKLSTFMRMRPSRKGGWRIAVIEDAHLMGVSSANAILKTLEEPPDSVLIILVTHQAGSLLDTIRSRSRTIHFQPLQKDDFERVLPPYIEEGVSPSDKELIYEITGGAPGQALAFLEAGGPSLFKTCLEHMDRLPSPDWHELHQLSDKISAPSKDEELRVFSHFQIWVLETLARSKARQKDAPSLLKNYSGLLEWQKQLSSTELARHADELRHHWDSGFRSYLDRKQLVFGSFTLLNSGM